MTNLVRIDCAITEQSNPRSDSHDDFNRIYELAKFHLSEQLHCPEDNLLLALRTRVTWPCNELTNKVEEGFRIVFQSEITGLQYCVHTNLDTDSFLCKLHKSEKQDFFKRLEVFAYLPRCTIL